jgi:hypothetical protein
LIPDTLRAGRVEVVDASGQLRAIFGRLGVGADGADAYGVSLLDRSGAERAALTFDAHGPSLVFVTAGNIAIQIGVDDSALVGDHSGPVAFVADSSGTPLVRLWVASDGSLRLDPPRSAGNSPP